MLQIKPIVPMRMEWGAAHGSIASDPLLTDYRMAAISAANMMETRCH